MDQRTKCKTLKNDPTRRKLFMTLVYNKLNFSIQSQGQKYRGT